MKALVLNELGGPENLLIQDIKEPEPAEGEVRIRIKRAALNRRDVWITVGKYPRVQLPSVGGSDGAGIVDSVGLGHFDRGDARLERGGFWQPESIGSLATGYSRYLSHSTWFSNCFG